MGVVGGVVEVEGVGEGEEGEVHSRAPEGEEGGEVVGEGGGGWVVGRKSSLSLTDMQVSVHC